jgi:small subunit ribosomal protein S20
MKRSEVRNQRNRHAKSTIKTFMKRFDSAESPEEAEQLYRKIASVLDSYAGKGIIHKNNAARKKSNLMNRLKAMYSQ